MNLIRIKVFPDAKKNSIEEISPQKLKISTKEPPQNNRANKSVLTMTAEFYQIPQNKLRMISGHQGNNKTVQILD